LRTSVHGLADSDRQVEQMVRDLRLHGYPEISVFYPGPDGSDLAQVGVPAPWTPTGECPDDPADVSAIATTAPAVPSPFAHRHAILGGGLVATLVGMGLAHPVAEWYAEKLRAGFALILVHDGDDCGSPASFNAAEAAAWPMEPVPSAP
jgi:hypothetical protein